jgi:hypothetical protein
MRFSVLALKFTKDIIIHIKHVKICRYGDENTHLIEITSSRTNTIKKTKSKA